MAEAHSSGVSAGRSYPIGATIYPDGVNFSLYSKNSTGVELVLFDDAGDPQPTRVIHLDPRTNRTFNYWHVFVAGLGAGQVYAFRVHGSNDPARGCALTAEKVLIDPYGRGVVVPKGYSRDAARLPGDNCATAMKSVVIDTRSYDWEGDTPPKHPFGETIIYEMHVRGFTRHTNSGVAVHKRGTYAGLVEKIPYWSIWGSRR